MQANLYRRARQVLFNHYGTQAFEDLTVVDPTEDPRFEDWTNPEGFIGVDGGECVTSITIDAFEGGDWTFERVEAVEGHTVALFTPPEGIMEHRDFGAPEEPRGVGP
jgi:hypothetical protein